jgi:predicted transcriptional regulator
MRIIAKDEMDNMILKNVGQKPGIRLNELSRAVGKPIETIRYRVYSLERSGDLKLENGRQCLKIYPATGSEAQ